MNKKILSFALVFLCAFNIQALAKESKGVEITSQFYEVIIGEDGNEYSFQTKTLKPEIIIDDRLTFENDNRKRRKFTYIKKIDKALHFLKHDSTEKIKFSFSEDGKNFVNLLNNLKHKYIKIEILNFEANETVIVNVRYEHNIYKYNNLK